MRTYKTVLSNDWRARMDDIGVSIRRRPLSRSRGIGSLNLFDHLLTIQQSLNLKNCYWSILLLGCRVRGDMRTCSTNSINPQASHGPSIRSWLRSLPGVGKPLSSPESITVRFTNTICVLHICGLVRSDYLTQEPTDDPWLLERHRPTDSIAYDWRSPISWLHSRSTGRPNV